MKMRRMFLSALASAQPPQRCVCVYVCVFVAHLEAAAVFKAPSCILKLSNYLMYFTNQEEIDYCFKPAACLKK